MCMIQQCLEQILVLVHGNRHDIFKSYVAVVVAVAAVVLDVVAVVKLQGHFEYFYTFFVSLKKVLYDPEKSCIYTGDFPCRQS